MGRVAAGTLFFLWKIMLFFLHKFYKPFIVFGRLVIYSNKGE